MRFLYVSGQIQGRTIAFDIAAGSRAVGNEAKTVDFLACEVRFPIMLGLVVWVIVCFALDSGLEAIGVDAEVLVLDRNLCTKRQNTVSGSSLTTSYCGCATCRLWHVPEMSRDPCYSLIVLE